MLAVLVGLAHADDVRAIQDASREILAADAGRAAELVDAIAPVCARVFLAPGDVGDGAAIGVVDHVVAKGENATTIAKRYRIGAGLIARLNRGYDPRALRVGQRLKVIDLARQPLRLVIVCSRFRLLAWRGETLVAALRVGLGAPATPTPRGETRVVLRARDPEWRDPDSGRIFPPKHPGNILGGFWMAFAPGDDGRFKSIGMHGFTGDDPQVWLEKQGSHGCVRLLQDDIGALFELALDGTAVSVRD